MIGVKKRGKGIKSRDGRKGREEKEEEIDVFVCMHDGASVSLMLVSLKQLWQCCCTSLYLIAIEIKRGSIEEKGGKGIKRGKNRGMNILIFMHEVQPVLVHLND